MLVCRVPFSNFITHNIRHDLIHGDQRVKRRLSTQVLFFSPSYLWVCTCGCWSHVDCVYTHTHAQPPSLDERTFILGEVSSSTACPQEYQYALHFYIPVHQLGTHVLCADDWASRIWPGCCNYEEAKDRIRSSFRVYPIGDPAPVPQRPHMFEIRLRMYISMYVCIHVCVYMQQQ